jgi:hypothetical protein
MRRSNSPPIWDSADGSIEAWLDGDVEMNTDRKRRTSDRQREKFARQRQEEALDDALNNTFPASDPVSIVQPASNLRGWPTSAKMTAAPERTVNHGNRRKAAKPTAVLVRRSP